MLVVIGQARAREGCRDTLVAAAANVAALTRADAGCEAYTFALDVNDPSNVISVEIWRDQAALDDHIRHDHSQAFITAVGNLVEGQPSMSFFAATPVGDATKTGAQS